MRLRFRFRVVSAAVLAVAVGCGAGCGPAGKATDPLTPAQYFRLHQGATVTPYGKVVIDSVAERGGKIEFNTEDGQRWRVGYFKRADGTYDYGTPDEVK